ncbi:hypothetical protein AB4501_29185, partial [Vibrio sp. 10N.222.55.E8]
TTVLIIIGFPLFSPEKAKKKPRYKQLSAAPWLGLKGLSFLLFSYSLLIRLIVLFYCVMTLFSLKRF